MNVKVITTRKSATHNAINRPPKEDIRTTAVCARCHIRSGIDLINFNKAIDDINLHYANASLTERVKRIGQIVNDDGIFIDIAPVCAGGQLKKCIDFYKAVIADAMIKNRVKFNFIDHRNSINNTEVEHYRLRSNHPAHTLHIDRLVTDSEEFSRICSYMGFEDASNILAIDIPYSEFYVTSLKEKPEYNKAESAHYNDASTKTDRQNYAMISVSFYIKGSKDKFDEFMKNTGYKYIDRVILDDDRMFGTPTVIMMAPYSENINEFCKNVLQVWNGCGKS